MAGAPNPIELQKHLKGVDYPAGKSDLVQAARDHGAGDDLVKALEKIPDRQYDGPNAVSKAVTEAS
ncbi:DUF2795 domain-containing protein [Planotetraspora sp. GP83]|uniref:DUF2795 domain-containing protein n=1 Tax=Planotetraspora sp. GP83 TaxID=3156264 RepID=UPI003514E38A